MSVTSVPAETFERRGGTGGKHGIVFQNQVAALLLARAVAVDPEVAVVGAELAHVGSFDDVSVRVRDVDGDGETLFLLLQLKHRVGSSPAVGSQALRGDKGSFCVRKYYRSYVNEVNVQRFGADPSRTYYVLFTNASLPESAFEPAKADEVPETLARLLNTGCRAGAAPKLLREDSDYLEGEARGPEFQRRFVWMGEQASEEEMGELLRQHVCVHVGRWASDASRRADLLQRAVEAWYDDTGHVDYLSAQCAAWRAVTDVDPPLLRSLRFHPPDIERLLQQIRDTDTGGVLHLSCDTLDEELRAAKITRAAAFRPLLIMRLAGIDDISDGEVALKMWEDGWCHELVLVIPAKWPTKYQVNQENIISLGERLLAILGTRTIPSRPCDCEGRSLIILSPPVTTSEKNHPLVSWLRNNLSSHFWSEAADSFSFRHLSRETRTSVLEVPIEIQGRKCTLGDLHQEHVLDAFLHGDSLAALMRSEGSMRIGSVISPQGVDDVDGNKLYIRRRLQKHVPVNVSILKVPHIDDIFCVKDISKGELDALVPPRAKVQLLDRQDEDTRFIVCRKMGWTRFRAFCEKYPHRRCHFLKNVDGTLMWRQSSGERSDRVSFVQRHLLAEGEENINNELLIQNCRTCTPYEDELVKAGLRTVLISADPGVGKSSVLARAAQLFSERYPSDWVIQLNLPDHTDALTEAAEAMGNAADDGGSDKVAALAAEKLLMCAAGLSRDPSASRDGDAEGPEVVEGFDTIAESLLKDRLWETGGLRVLVDAFDEISPDYTEVVVAILKALQSSCISSLWVASRQFLEQRLELELGVGAFGIKPLAVADQEQFWIQYWSRTQGNALSREELSQRAHTLLRLLGGKFRSQFRLNIPLHSSILAETFGKSFLEDDVETYVKHCDRVYVYKKFIDAKFDIYFRNKANITGNNVAMKSIFKALEKDFMDNHKVCALMEIELFDHLPGKLQKEMYEKTSHFLSGVKMGCEKTGIITCVRGGKPRFLHRTFAEYLAGIWVAENHNFCSGILDTVMRKQFKFVKAVADHVISKKHPLHNAVLNDDIFKLNDLLKKNELDINENDCGGRSALSLAVQKNSEIGLAMSKILFEKGAKVYGYRELHFAAVNNAWDNIKYLLHHCSFECSDSLRDILTKILDDAHRKELITDEDRSFKNLYLNLQWNIFSRQRSILHIAVESGDEETVLVLLQRGADPRSFDGDSNTPLHYAVRHGFDAIVKLLLKCNSLVNSRNVMGETPLFIACSQGHESIARQLLSHHATMAFCSKSGTTLLHASIDHPSVLLLLLARGFKINTTDLRGSTVLHQAVRDNKVNVVSLLIEHGANVNCTNFQGSTPLLLAATASHTQIARMLLDSRANASMTNSRGDTALHFAIHKKNAEMVLLLLQHGADPEVENMRRETPRMLANKYDLSELMTPFLRKCPLRETTNTARRLPKVAAVNETRRTKNFEENGIEAKPIEKSGAKMSEVPVSENQCVAQTRQLQEQVPVSNPRPTGTAKSKELLAAVKRKDVKYVKQVASGLSKNLGDWLATTADGDTALHWAAKNCSSEIVSLLCSRAPREALSMRNNTGATPAHLAAVRKDHSVSLALQAAGADMIAVDDNGDTPMHISCRLAVYKQVRYLCPRLPEAVFSHRNVQGDTPLHLALALGGSKEEDAALGSVEINKGATLLVCYESKSISSHWQMPGDGRTGVLVSRTERPSSRAQLVRVVLDSTPKSAVLSANAAGDTPLHVAARGRKVEGVRSTWCADILRLLMEHGADVTLPNTQGDTVLHEVCRNPGELSSVNVLLHATNAREALNIRNSLGSTPLHVAVEHCNDRDIVRLLVEKGARPSIANGKGELPFHVAKRVYNFDVFDYLTIVSKHMPTAPLENRH